MKDIYMKVFYYITLASLSMPTSLIQNPMLNLNNNIVMVDRYGTDYSNTLKE